MINQTANLRCGVPGHIQFIDDAAEQAYYRQVEAARARQVAPFVVAPLCTVPTRRGVLEVGAEVSVQDLDDAVDERSGVVLHAVERLRRLVRAGIVLEKL